MHLRRLLRALVRASPVACVAAGVSHVASAAARSEDAPAASVDHRRAHTSASDLAAWLHSVHPAGERVVVLEAGYGPPPPEMQHARLPGAAYLDTNLIEAEALQWGRVPDAQLHALLDRLGVHPPHGASPGSPVVVYSRGGTIAAARVAHVLFAAGVTNLRILDGGWEAWVRAGLPWHDGGPVEGVREAPPSPRRTSHAWWPRPTAFTTIDEVAAIVRDAMAAGVGASASCQQQQQPQPCLVSVRSWAEFTGARSGYSYIAEAGDIPTAHWGGAGEECSNSMRSYHEPLCPPVPPAAVRASELAPGTIPTAAAALPLAPPPALPVAWQCAHGASARVCAARHDGRLLPDDVVLAMWHSRGFDPLPTPAADPPLPPRPTTTLPPGAAPPPVPCSRVIFHCGTGWRASEAFWILHDMVVAGPLAQQAARAGTGASAPPVSVFEGGWLAWSSDPRRPRRAAVPHHNAA